MLLGNLSSTTIILWSRLAHPYPEALQGLQCTSQACSWPSGLQDTGRQGPPQGGIRKRGHQSSRTMIDRVSLWALFQSPSGAHANTHLVRHGKPQLASKPQVWQTVF